MKKEQSLISKCEPIAQNALIGFSLGEISKKELIKALDEGTKQKRAKCKNKDGSFNYFKMAEMYHEGKW